MHTRMNIFTLLIITIGSTNVVTAVRDMPTFLKICHRNDPHLNDCIKRSVDSLRPYLKTGIPELQIPPCEPLHIPQVEINQSAGPVSLKSKYTNIEILKGTNFILRRVKIDIDKDYIRLILYIPYLEMTMKYDISGKILMLPITGNGMGHGNCTNINFIATIQCERYQSRKTEKIHYRVTDFNVDFDIGHINIHFDNLFDGDNILSNAMNLFLNDNWKIVAAETKPATEEAVSELFKKFSNKIFSKYPLDALLPS